MNTRQELIVRRLAEQVSCEYGELAKLADVSIMTIRRDVDVLVEKGTVIKTLRGCRKAPDPSSALLHETSLFSRINNQAQEKRAIAETAMETILAGETVYLDGSTTCLELARCIANERRG